MPELRIGLGTDLHVLSEGRPCILGGHRFDCPVGPEGHSDGDAVLHALTDALLGAGGLPDLGSLFPDSDPRWKDASSESFLAEALTLLGRGGWQALSVDMVVHCERPRIGPHREEMREKIATLLGIERGRVNLKGKSLEGTAGNRETISVTAVALLRKRKDQT